jgi:hypothetical protein
MVGLTNDDWEEARIRIVIINKIEAAFPNLMNCEGLCCEPELRRLRCRVDAWQSNQSSQSFIVADEKSDTEPRSPEERMIDLRFSAEELAGIAEDMVRQAMVDLADSDPCDVSTFKTVTVQIVDAIDAAYPPLQQMLGARFRNDLSALRA